MSVKQGTLVRVDGMQATVETQWAQGKHRVFKLSDGRQIIDLDKLVADGRATVETLPVVKPDYIAGIDKAQPGGDQTIIKKWNS
jgi:hypothetical protein